MAAALTAALMFATVAAALSLLLYLPALAIVESVSPRRAGARAAIWLLALALPIAGGVVGSAIGLHSALLDEYGSPHLTAGRPHLCARWLLAMPDARWLLTILGAVCAGLIVVAIIRLILSSLRSWLATHRLRAGLPARAGVVTVESDAPFIATVGFLSPATVVTSGTEELLSTDELEAALAHEGAHVRRRDNLADLIGSACVVCVPFPPTAHLFLRYWREEAERACDDAAAAATSPEATASAMAKLARAAEAASEDRLLTSTTHRWRHAAADVRSRGARLLEDHTAEESAFRDQSAVFGILLGLAGLTALALGIAATARQLDDTLHCLAETLLTVLR